MDDIVLQAMRKWPHVPACTGWLGLSERGHWYMRDASVQQAGSFQSGGIAARGAKLEHDKLVAFIGRNYASDVHGRWYFQNGPQKVFVELQVAPWILRLTGDGIGTTHTGIAANLNSAWLDEAGRLYCLTDHGLGLIHSQDMLHAADWLERTGQEPQSCLAAEMPQRFGFVLSPQATSAANLL